MSNTIRQYDIVQLGPSAAGWSAVYTDPGVDEGYFAIPLVLWVLVHETTVPVSRLVRKGPLTAGEKAAVEAPPEVLVSALNVDSMDVQEVAHGVGNFKGFCLTRDVGDSTSRTWLSIREAWGGGEG